MGSSSTYHSACLSGLCWFAFCWPLAFFHRPARRRRETATNFSRARNLVAWCIVPFDARKRGPEERAAMLARLQLPMLAYDYRAEHIPTVRRRDGGFAGQRHPAGGVVVPR